MLLQNSANKIKLKILIPSHNPKERRIVKKAPKKFPIKKPKYKLNNEFSIRSKNFLFFFKVFERKKFSFLLNSDLRIKIFN